MDGAKYHKRRISPVPSSNDRKETLQRWLVDNDVEYPANACKAELLNLIRMNKGKVAFACVEIAKKYGHEVLYTPPYHCELQPIEGVWAVVKNEVARQPRQSTID